MFWTRNSAMLPRATFGRNLDLFNRIIGNAFDSDAVPTYPACNICGSEEGAVISSELPGIRMEDLDIVAQGKVISIKGSRKDEADEKSRYLRRERPEGEFARSIEMPFLIDADKVEAKLVNGVLEIKLPRAESDKPKKIVVSAS